jgi:hypothetical protein
MIFKYIILCSIFGIIIYNDNAKTAKTLLNDKKINNINMRLLICCENKFRKEVSEELICKIKKYYKNNLILNKNTNIDKDTIILSKDTLSYYSYIEHANLNTLSNIYKKLTNKSNDDDTIIRISISKEINYCPLNEKREVYHPTFLNMNKKELKRIIKEDKIAYKKMQDSLLNNEELNLSFIININAKYVLTKNK